MALFNDGTIATAEDLRAYESSILETAGSESIDLTVKLDLAQREVGASIHRFLIDQTAPENEPPSVGLDRVVVTDALFQWHVLRTLELILRDAYHNQLNDRYKAKWIEYRRESTLAQERYFETGVGIVRVPVTKAAPPTVTKSPGVMPNSTFEIRVTWQNAADQEGTPSDAVLFTTDDGSIPVVDAGVAPAGGIRWNVYANSTKQAAGILPSVSWTMPPTGLIDGSELKNGQQPDYYLRLIHRLRRA